jgi:hypothetical protein
MFVAHRRASLAQFFSNWKGQLEKSKAGEAGGIVIEEVLSSSAHADSDWSWSQLCHGTGYHFFKVKYCALDKTQRVATRRFSEFHLLAVRLAEIYPQAGILALMPPKRYCWLSTPEQEAGFLLRRCYELALFLRYLCSHQKIVRHHVFQSFLPLYCGAYDSSADTRGSHVGSLLLQRGGLAFREHTASAGTEPLTIERMAAQHSTPRCY